jgi:hypothetical protein
MYKELNAIFERREAERADRSRDRHREHGGIKGSQDARRHRDRDRERSRDGYKHRCCCPADLPSDILVGGLRHTVSA